VGIFSSREGKGCEEQLGCTWIDTSNEVDTFVANDQEHPQIVEICAELKKLLGQMQNLHFMMCRKKRIFISVTIARNLLLHLCSSAHLSIPHCAFSKICKYEATATIP
jgi:hypothetical protein